MPKITQRISDKNPDPFIFCLVLVPSDQLLLYFFSRNLHVCAHVHRHTHTHRQDGYCHAHHIPPGYIQGYMQFPALWLQLHPIPFSRENTWNENESEWHYYKNYFQLANMYTNTNKYICMYVYKIIPRPWY